MSETGTTTRERARHMWIAAGAAVVCCALLIGAGPAGAASSSRVILKPKPGQKVTWHPLRLVVRAGPETDDLGARLNGVAIGREFQRKGRHRVLVVSRSHGLRHGPNKLTVVARTANGTRERRSTVRFKVAHKLPLTGAGRYRRIVAGVRTELVGRVKEHPSGPSGARVRWKLVDVPRGSRLRTASRSRRERQRVGRQSSGSPSSSGLREASSLTPTFKPDVHGTYRFAVTAGRGSRATIDQVELDSVPADPLVEVNAGVFKDGVPGVSVEGKHYPAPKLFGQDYPFRTNGYTDADQDPSQQALFQVLVLDRSTTEVVSNRTYGVCVDDNGSPDTCRLGPTPIDRIPGAPGQAPMADEITAQTEEGLIIVNSLPASLHGPGGADFSRRYVASLGLPELAGAIGFPDITARLAAAPLEGLSGIGVPGMEPGEATVALVPGRLDGYLVPDKNSPRNYSYVNKTRVPFDTRATVPGCDGNAGCVTQTIDDQTHTHTEADGAGGFLVSVNDRDTLALRATEYFRTIGGQEDPRDGVLGMTAFLQSFRDAGSLVTISSVHTPGMNPQFLIDSRTGSADWHRLATEVAALGGTLHRFNTAAVTPGEDYTLVGFGGAGEGNGVEAVGPGSRIRGMLVPDKESRFGPANVSESAEEPPEVLIELMLQPPNEEWTMQLPGEGSGQLSSKPWWPEGTADDSPGTRAAIPFIGGQVSQLTEDPRSAYWVNATFDPGDASKDVGRATLVDPDTGETCACTQPELDKAKDQLDLELEYVDKVRKYLGNLAYPSGVAGEDAWGEAKSVADELAKDRAFLDEKAEAELDAIEGAFGIVASLLDLGEVGAAIKGLSKTKKFLKASAAILELAAESTGLAWDGSKSGEDPDEARVIADDVGMELQKQAQDVSKGFRSLGDVIVSDWGKLSVVGKHGGCDPPPAKKGCPAGLVQLAFTDEMKDAATTAADLAQRRTAYQHLLPYSFPIWNTGLSHSCSRRPCSPDTGPEPKSAPLFGCDSDFSNGPFDGVAEEGFFLSLHTLDPTSYYFPEKGGKNVWRTYLSAGRSGLVYGWASDEIYKAMFDPVGSKQENPKVIPLGISPLDYMIEANERRPYIPEGTDCSWDFSLRDDL